MDSVPKENSTKMFVVTRSFSGGEGCTAKAITIRC